MTALETLIATAKVTLASPSLGIVGKNRLSTAIAVAESARAALCDVKNSFGTFILAIERTLESGAELSFHGFNDPHYSKVTTCCAAAQFRMAWRNLASAHDDATKEIAGYRDLLRRAKFSG